MEWQTHRANPYFGMDIGHNRIEPEWGPDAPVRPLRQSGWTAKIF